MATPTLFRTVANHDYLGFWANGTLNSREVARFLDLDKHDIAKVADVAPTSVRFDEKIPKEVLERLQEIANICGLVAQYFDGHVAKTALWFKTTNPLLGNISPRDMIRFGRYEKLRRFVNEALAEGDLPRPPKEPEAAKPGTEMLKIPSLVEQNRETVARLCERYGVRELALFGSSIRADFDPVTSDVDLAVVFGPAPNQSLADQYFDFKEQFEHLVGRPVDLVELEAMPPTRLKRIIERTKVPIYAAA